MTTATNLEQRLRREKALRLVNVASRHKCFNGCIDPYVSAFEVDGETIVVCLECGRKTIHETGRVISTGRKAVQG